MSSKSPSVSSSSTLGSTSPMMPVLRAARLRALPLATVRLLLGPLRVEVPLHLTLPVLGAVVRLGGVVASYLQAGEHRIVGRQVGVVIALRLAVETGGLLAVLPQPLHR
ncbi:MAG: hypothetical protein L0J23_02520, partial [Bifidobacterium crudilactis]|nr:hypothetical protein [Bifidobacterium crudilactis]